MAPTPPPIPPGLSAAPAGALTPEQLADLARARTLGKKVRRAIAVATADAWTTGIFGGLSLLLSFGSLPAMLLGAGMATLSFFQFRSVGRLKALDSAAPRHLAGHQLLLGLLLLAYAGYSLWQGLNHPQLMNQVAQADPQVAEMMAGFAGLERLLYQLVYGTLMAVAGIGTGAAALYYWTRQKHIQAYREQTPPWILALQQAGMSL